EELDLGQSVLQSLIVPQERGSRGDEKRRTELFGQTLGFIERYDRLGRTVDQRRGGFRRNMTFQNGCHRESTPCKGLIRRGMHRRARPRNRSNANRQSVGSLTSVNDC